VRAGAVLWVMGWLPASHIVIPLHMVVAADRYLLLPTLGSSLVIAWALWRLPVSPRARAALVAAIALASGARALDARSTWQSDRTLWQRAVESDPHDAAAWSHYAYSVDDPAQAMAIVDDGIAHVDAPRLWLRKALLLLAAGDRDGGVTWLRRAAEAREPKAMADLAAVLLDEDPGAALTWATGAVAIDPNSAQAQRTLGRAALATGSFELARTALQRAVDLEPTNPQNTELLRSVPRR
jgi:tetratricopeptide (TPR) repeat protein